MKNFAPVKRPRRRLRPVSIAYSLPLIDTHLAALISAAFLFLFGTGPIKGFAVALVIGLVSNMFTAVFVSRTLFEWSLARQGAAARINI